MSYTDSAPATALVTFAGVWMSDPLDAENTVRQFPYGSAARTRTVATEQTALRFVGRSYPVVDYGEQLDDQLAVRIDVPHGTDWADDLASLRGFAEAQRITTVRDNRGRSLTGALTGYSEADQEWGTQVSFTVTRSASTVVSV
jgi:hypothetical protein